MTVVKKYSLIVLLLCAGFLAIFRLTHVSEKEIYWDILGYYLYLPATFVHHDPMLNDIEWLKSLNAEKELAGTLYMVSSNQHGEPMYFFLMGMAMFYLPFFLGAHTVACFAAYPADGFSLPYQYALVFGGIIYTLIGLIFLRKILLRFFSETLTAFLLLLIVFGTNYIQHLNLDNLGTVNVLFMLTAIIVYSTIQWHENFHRKHLLVIGISFTLAALVKPSEVFVLIIPLLWNVTTLGKLKEKLSVLWTQRKILLLTIGISFLIALPQMIYWYLKTGSPIYDSYKNPGVGLDIRSPHLLDFLFSYRKGWLLYTPLMIFALTGFYNLYRNNRSVFYPVVVYFAVSLYIIASWTEWWYGAAFSARPIIAAYPVLAISLGYFLRDLKKRHRSLRLAVFLCIAFFVFLNQFQWWQYRNYILHPYRTTKAYYMATFLKTKLKPEYEDLLLVYRDFSGKMLFSDVEKYESEILMKSDFESDSADPAVISEEGQRFLRLPAANEYFAMVETPYHDLTFEDHVWIRASICIRLPDSLRVGFPRLVFTMERKEGVYGYYAVELNCEEKAEWKTFVFDYQTPEIRDSRDLFKCYIWNCGKMTVDVDNVEIQVFERRKNTG